MSENPRSTGGGVNQQQLVERLRDLRPEGPVRIMEVCGTHTTEFFRTGIKDLFPPSLSLIDGPGCPVCVTPNGYLDRAMEIARKHRVILTSFGDMMRVPSSSGSLLEERANGLEVETVYSPLDAVELARSRPDREVVFLSVGFETTVPTEAIAVERARKMRITNFSLLCGNKLTPPAVAALLDAGEVRIDGFILPGHVSVITGVEGWRFVAEKYNKPCVIAGFEARDLLVGTLTLVKLIQEERAEIINTYRRVVRDGGNRKAQRAIRDIFETVPANWRGLGVIPDSGLRLRRELSEFDAEHKFPVTPPPEVEPKGCRCGEVLRGVIGPQECPLFARRCTPATPVGACMVSSEGSCAAYYKYSDIGSGS